MKKLSLENKIWYLVLIWVAITYILAIPILRNAYQSNKEWPNGDKIGYMSIAVAEVVAPIWITPLYFGKLITIGVENSEVYGDIKSIACYAPDGTGPYSEGCEGTLAKVKCYSKKHHNGNAYEVKCPFF